MNSKHLTLVQNANECGNVGMSEWMSAFGDLLNSVYNKCSVMTELQKNY